MEDKLAQSYRAMFDLKFQEAFKAADEAKAVAQNDPLPYVAQAWVAFFRELDRLHALRSEVLPLTTASTPAIPTPGSRQTKRFLTAHWTARKSWRRTA